MDRYGGDFSAEVRRQVEAWSAHPALAELVDMFGGSLPQGLGLAARLAFLDEFSAVWDYRGRARARGGGRVHSQDAAGAVRWLIPRLNSPASQLDKITALAGELGLTGESAPEGADFDYMLVIGGGRYTNLLRAGYAREMATGRRIGHVVLAAASRRLLDSEEDAVASCAPGARTEFELLVAAAADAFGLDARQAGDHLRRRVVRPQRDRTVWNFTPDTNDVGVPITLLETPSPDPDNRRANSGDTYTFAARTVGMHRSTCLLVTGQPVVPYLHFEALRTLALPFEIRVESVGFGVDRYNRLSALDQQHPAKLLQEVRSAIRSARALVEQLATPVGKPASDG
ncbi:hypothetical protein [Mycobacterium lacus]|uniref:hypothetical protein n=1 Tax=Mycobacterium lacus TaxID=169765 RepID=UPI000A1632C6|nr:hypothetical protein [Mycobacterium lacus]MCV7122267.1 hypothetical protein [Mycobacterium lacus]ORW10410.1 hypothetical protein AWC15_16950 [Mycobacterium lacus]